MAVNYKRPILSAACGAAAMVAVDLALDPGWVARYAVMVGVGYAVWLTLYRLDPARTTP